MTATTIKVSSDLRDRLKARAEAHGRTIGEHLEVLLAEEARAERFTELRRAMARTPPDAAYARELADWQGDQWN